MNLDAFLSSKNLFTKEECIIINDAFKDEIIRKKDVIPETNKYSKRILFIESGLLRTFYYDEGKDITHFFFDENKFIAPINSILYHNKTERYQWEAIEECSVKVILYEDFLNLEEQFPKLSRLMFEFAMHMIDLLSQKLNLLQFQTAQDKYKTFLEMYPDLHYRVSLGSTASFLGITQQTLSVIRAKKKLDHQG
ncbi:MAG: Crp/Fnr family transcriptional regulator [Bacteroidota bacterium]